MAKSTRAKPRKKSSVSTPTNHAARDAALNAIDAVYSLRESLLALQCLQGFLSPTNRPALDELNVEPGELRSLVRCINAETQRRLFAVGEAVESVQEALH